MIEIRCPDHSIARFPEGTSDEQIAAALRREFPEQRPASLEPGERARRGNGAEVSFSPVMQRFVVEDASGTPRGFRTTLDAALDLADSIAPLPVKATPKPQPKPEPSRHEIAAAEHQIAEDIDIHIRQSESRNRRERRRSAM